MMLGDETLNELGVVIANYHGHGNLIHALRLLRKTLSCDRPVIVTIDNDEPGAQIIKKGRSLVCADNDLLHFHPIPAGDIVEYPRGHWGGSFEEMFSVGLFLDCCFSLEMMDQTLRGKRNQFEQEFDAAKPWLSQVKRFCHENGNTAFATRKPELAKILATRCDPIPDTVLQLEKLIERVRRRYPVKTENELVMDRLRERSP
jgi:hypothetical protein